MGSRELFLRRATEACGRYCLVLEGPEWPEGALVIRRNSLKLLLDLLGLTTTHFENQIIRKWIQGQHRFIADQSLDYLLHGGVIPTFICITGNSTIHTISPQEWSDIARNVIQSGSVSQVSLPVEVIVLDDDEDEPTTEALVPMESIVLSRKRNQPPDRSVYERLDRVAAADCLVARDECIKRLRAENRSLKRKIEVIERDALVPLPATPDDCFLVTRVGTTWLTPHGAMAVAIRRNCANISAHNLGIAILEDMSTNTVIKAELQCAAAIIVSMRRFNDNMNVAMDELSLSDVFSISALSFMSDATCADLWQQSKLCGTYFFI
jgi:hypothetical protein